MSYLSSYIPTSTNTRSRQITTEWRGLNREQPVDSGELSSCTNISTKHQPFLYTEREGKISDRIVLPGLGSTNSERKINSIFSFDNIVIVIEFVKFAVSLFSMYIRYYDLTKHDPDLGAYVGSGNLFGKVFTQTDYDNNIPRSLTRFNSYTQPSAIVSSGYTRKILIFPDAYSFDFNQSGDFTASSISTTLNQVPNLTYVTSYGGRIFGVKDGKIYASAYNSYSDWTLDTADDISSAHAWVSATQTNTNADAEFTGITVYDGHVMAFKQNLIHQLYNTKNPFRMAEISESGAINNFAHCVYRNVLYYIANDGVYAYTGGVPRRISDKLNIDDYSGSVMCAKDDVIYCFIPSFGIATYCVDSGTWGELTTVSNMVSNDTNTPVTIGTPIAMAVSQNTIFVASRDSSGSGETYRIHELQAGNYGDFSFTTYLNYGMDVKERAIRRIRLIVEHGGNQDSSVSLQVGNSEWSHVFSGAGSEKVITILVPKSAGYEHRITINGYGGLVFKYMITEYADIGEADKLT